MALRHGPGIGERLDPQCERVAARSGDVRPSDLARTLRAVDGRSERLRPPRGARFGCRSPGALFPLGNATGPKAGQDLNEEEWDSSQDAPPNLHPYVRLSATR